MSETKKEIAPAWPASTVLLLRDGADGIEVFMVVRHKKIDFAGGALVFPGGKVDDNDYADAVVGRCDGSEGLSPKAVGLRVAAIRETFEEVGFLLAREKNSADLITGGRFDQLCRDYRVPLHRGEVSIAQMLVEEDLRLACDLLIPFAHWITPERVPKRFDTYFYAVPAPQTQIPEHDGTESVDSVWIRPAVAVAEAEAGERSVMFPTRLNLNRLENGGTVDNVLVAAGEQALVTVMPTMKKADDGSRILTIPEEAGYGGSEFVVDYPGAVPG